MKIIYGSAKLTNYKYGYGSRYNKIKFEQSFKIIKNRIEAIEVSKRYYHSIPKLAPLIKKDKKVKVHYKLDNLNVKSINEKKIYSEINYILKIFKIDFIDILYLHQNDLDILCNKKIIKILKKLKKNKLIKNIGCSIYSKKELLKISKLDIYNVYQIPINITDTYLYSECIKLKKFKNIKIVARSIFLQGTLLNDIKKHKFKKQINNYKKKISNFCLKNKFNYYEYLIQFIKSLSSIDYVIIGSINKDNLNLFFKVFNNKKLNKNINNDFRKISEKKKIWNNPQRW